MNAWTSQLTSNFGLNEAATNKCSDRWEINGYNCNQM